MARAEILIEDDGEGAAVRFLFVDGWDSKSPAHQMCNIIRAKLDEMTAAGDLTALSERTNTGDTSEADAELAKISG